MAIVFNCPHCATNYRLKDEFGGKTATCKNPNCRKVIAIPKSNGATPALTAADLDAMAAAAFADEPARADKPAEQMIKVTCSGCDHVWSVEVSKEGKNVRCPECGKVVRAPMRKKEEKADWRTGGGGPSLARRETGLDREGAFGTVNAGGISEGTAREIVKGREAEEEPEERRKRLIKRAVLFFLIVSVGGVIAYFVFQQRRIDRAETRMEDAVAEITGPNGTKDGRFVGLIYRASTESRIRLAGSAEDATTALKELQLARNRAKGSPGAAGGSADNAAVVAEVAITAPLLLGNAEQIEKGHRHKADVVTKEIRQALAEISDAELVAEVVRGVTREAAKKEHPLLAEGVAHQRHDGPELLSQIGLELLRIDRSLYRGDAENLLQKVGNADTNGAQALRAALGKPGLVKKEGEPPAAPSAAAAAEAAAINGDAGKAREALKAVARNDKAKALAAVGQTFVASNPTEATPILVEAAKTLKEAQGTISPWVSIRVCRLLGRTGQFDEAESLAATLPDEQTKAWGRLEALRGRLESLKEKGNDSWLEPIGDPTKFAAAAKAREVMARHNAAAGIGGEYQGLVRKWPQGTVRPFGMAGLVLGQLDADKK